MPALALTTMNTARLALLVKQLIETRTAKPFAPTIGLTMQQIERSETPTSRNVDALFVDPSGLYPELLGADHCWDEKRDARKYDGNGPVIAHPPCARWCGFAKLNQRLYGRNVGDDGGCFDSALDTVNQVCGVLEHPYNSLAWPAFELKRPTARGWEFSHRQPNGTQVWVCEVWQSAYGFPAQKRTFLYYVGAMPPFDLRWDRPKGTRQVGWYDYKDKNGKVKKKPLSKKEAAATPIAFAEELIRLARYAKFPLYSYSNVVVKINGIEMKPRK